VDAFLDSGPTWLSTVRSEPAWETALDSEPFPQAAVARSQLDEVLAGFADFVDLKCPYLYGHSSGVSRIVGAAAASLGLDDAIGRVRRAALVHDLGRVGISNTVWDRAGRLTMEDWERVRLHPYYTERILARCSLWPELSAACQHHERLDGSGYHRSLGAARLTMEERLLAAADVFQALTQDRPHRPRRSTEQAVDELTREVEAGLLDARCVGAVAEVAGHRQRDLARWPDDLTDREIDVLRLLARGRSNKQIAAELVISPKTAGHHLEHIYSKIEVRTRAGAALYAMEHGLAE
jgi:HD-GYP domain-containing protein (c-di-GMP phosphodiesterase class II)